MVRIAKLLKFDTGIVREDVFFTIIRFLSQIYSPILLKTDISFKLYEKNSRFLFTILTFTTLINK